jgi:diphthine-ammonia ligase
MHRLRKALHVQSRSYWAPANIGPYSQAQSVPLSITTHPNTQISAVHIAGQIPLLPGTMNLPEEYDRDRFGEELRARANQEMRDFGRQTALSLQHLWRIGKVMDVIWWTGAVAYLSRDTIQKISSKAKLAAAAWQYQNFATKPAKDNDDEDITGDERDLWEERHHGGLQNRSGMQTIKQLPDWSAVINGDETSNNTPPFFAAEIEELPRGSSIEWQAFPGLTDGSIKTSTHSIPSIGTISTCTVADHTTYTTLFLTFAQNISSLAQTIDLLLSKIETPAQTTQRKQQSGYGNAQAAYLDVGVGGLWDEVEGDYGGVVPCRSLWDWEGKRLAAVLLFESCVEGEGED